MKLETHIYQIEEKTIFISIDWEDYYYECPIVYTSYNNMNRKMIWSDNNNPTLDDIILFEMDSILSNKEWKMLKSVANLNSSYYPWN